MSSLRRAVQSCAYTTLSRAEPNDQKSHLAPYLHKPFTQSRHIAKLCVMKQEIFPWHFLHIFSLHSLLLRESHGGGTCQPSSIEVLCSSTPRGVDTCDPLLPTSNLFKWGQSWEISRKNWPLNHHKNNGRNFMRQTEPAQKTNINKTKKTGVKNHCKTMLVLSMLCILIM